MKKLLFGLFFIALFSVSAQAQKVSINAGLAYSNAGSHIDESVGLMYGFVFSEDKVELAGDFNYYFDEAGDPNVSPWAFNVDVHYVTLQKGKISVFPIIGMNVSQVYALTNVGLNMGLGSRYELNKRLAVFSNYKYVFGNMDASTFNIGINLKP